MLLMPALNQKLDEAIYFPGAGMGILYSVIVYKWILKHEELDKIVLFLNTVHEV